MYLNRRKLGLPAVVLHLFYNILLKFAERVEISVTDYEYIIYATDLEEWLLEKSTELQNSYSQKTIARYVDLVYKLVDQHLTSSGPQDDQVEDTNLKSIFILDYGFPRELRTAAAGPIVLYYEGDVSILSSKLVSIVGTRKSTFYGEQSVQRLCEWLAQRNMVTVSGLALGTDQLVHENSLKLGMKTIAVLPSNLDQIVPASNYGLAKRIVRKGGLLLSEYAVEAPKGLYPRYLPRNRIIAAISPVTVIMEADISSGAIYTARYANSFGRKVFALTNNGARERFSGGEMLFDNDIARPLTSTYKKLAEQYSTDAGLLHTKKIDKRDAAKQGSKVKLAETIRYLDEFSREILGVIADGINTVAEIQSTLSTDKSIRDIEIVLAKLTISKLISRSEFGQYKLTSQIKY